MEGQIVQYMLLSETAIPPERMTISAAGYDVYSPREYIIQPQCRQRIPLDIMFVIKEGYHGLLYSRSGLVEAHNVHVAAGVIDSDYRGNVSVFLMNHSKYIPFFVGRGMRIAQMLIHKTIVPILQEIPNPNLPRRRAGGFGSTGYW